MGDSPMAEARSVGGAAIGEDDGVEVEAMGVGLGVAVDRRLAEADALEEGSEVAFVATGTGSPGSRGPQWPGP